MTSTTTIATEARAEAGVQATWPMKAKKSARLDFILALL